MEIPSAGLNHDLTLRDLAKPGFNTAHTHTGLSPTPPPHHHLKHTEMCTVQSVTTVRGLACVWPNLAADRYLDHICIGQRTIA
jgi:hypothetical protein